MKKILLAMALATFVILTCPNSYAENIESINRYATVSLEPTSAQKNPLVAVGSFKFKSDVITVGDAVNQVLSETGYALASSSKMENITIETLNKPLPFVDRKIGPMKIQSILLILMGDQIFDLQIDIGNRLVNFRVKPKFKAIYQ